jgi:tetratricopeptide (TPR) repeat protein
MSSKAVLLAILIACVCAAVIAVHWPALSAQALSFDDNEYLVDNALVKSPSWFSAWKFLSQVLEPSTVKGYYQPLAMISLMFDYSLGGRVENLLPFHRTSLALHAANTALIIVLLYLLFGEVWIAAAAGLLFGLHPMTVETIPWVGERKTLLAAFFALWSLLFYLRYTHALTVIPARNVTPAKTGRAGIQSPVGCSTWGFYVACFLFYLLALMSKPTSTPLPVLMLLLDFWPLKRLKWQLFLEKIPFFILGGIFAIVTYISQTRTAVTISPVEMGIGRVFFTLCHNIIFYLCKIIWPVNLSSHYPFPDPLNLSQPMVLAGVIGTCILIPLLLISLRWTRAALIGWLFFFIAILPTMGIIGFTNVIASDKFAYLPSFGLLMILASFLCNLWLKNSVISGSKSVVIILFVLILASAESLATRSYLIHWRNSVGLCEYMLSKAPNAPSPHYNLGVAYGELGRYQDAVEAFKQAIRIKPDYAEAHCNLGVAYGKLGRWQEAIEAFSQAIKIKTDYAEAHYNLGVAYGKLGRYQEAVEAYKQAIRIKPDYAEAYYNLGVAYGELGRYQEAVESYKQAIRIKPDYAEAHYSRGVAYNSIGRYQDAVEPYKQAIRIKPDYTEAHYNLGVVYSSLGRSQEALESYKQAIRIKPDYADAHYNLGITYYKLGRYQDAIESYKQTIRIKPDYAKAYINLGVTYYKLGRYQDAIEAYKQAIRIKPDFADVHYTLGVAYLVTGDKESALEEYKILKTLDAEKANELFKLINK